MANLYPVAGCRIFIGSAAVEDNDDDLVLADFSGVTWTEIKSWTQMGDFGDSAALITTPIIGIGRDKKQKGTNNAGSMQNVFASKPGDAGQTALLLASKTKNNYPIKIVLNDAPAVGSAPAPGERYFYALVMTASESGGNANTIRNLNATLEINSNIVAVAPTSGSVPVNTVLPSIAGIPEVGEVLTGYPGSWSGGVDTFAYQWKNAGVNIVGATSSTYTPVVGDVGDVLTLQVTATNAAGAGTPAVSAPAPAVIA